MEFWSDLPSWLRLVLALIVFGIGVLIFLFISWRLGLGVAALGIILMAVVIGFACRLLFNIDHQETMLIGTLLALLSWGIGFVVYGGLLLGLRAVVASRTAPPPAAAPPPPAAVVPAPTPPTVPAVPARNAADRNVEQRLTVKAFVREAREYNERAVVPQQARVVERFYAAGATGVWFDLEGSRRARPVRMYVKLPQDPAARMVCQKLYVECCAQLGVKQQAVLQAGMPEGYLIIALPE